MIKTRFCPSPTGYLHLGNARTALFSALYAKSAAGHFILRIEDTDAVRSEEKYTEQLQVDLHWLGVDWQEGPVVGGEYGPYFQSERRNIYDKYYQQLIEKNLAYPCFCTDQELMLNRKIQLSRGQAPKYPGTCSALTAEDIQARLAKGLKPALRFRVPAKVAIEFIDVVKGPQKFNSDDIGDFIIRRADGSSSFMFCNAVDDALMKVTHVLRGEDHLTNTPRQLLILSALQLIAPQYGHLSLIASDDGSQLSKRQGSASLQDFHAQGYLPVALINYLARLGHGIEEQKLFNFADLAERFRLDKLSKSSARFDQHQLLFWQKTAVMNLSNEAMWQWLGNHMKTSVPDDKRIEFIDMVRKNCCFPQEAEKWAEIFFAGKIHRDEESSETLKNVDAKFFASAQQAISLYGIDFKAVLDHIKNETGLSGKNLFLPMRLVLTGERHGAELAQIAAMLGKEEMIKRFKEFT